MRKVLVFQHVAHEILGTLDPLLKKNRFRVRYVNFERHPNEEPSLDKYAGLIVLGGYMGVYESDRYTHIKHEMKVIEEALKKQIPILGICLGAQILAHVLGANVRKHAKKEVGWHDVHLTDGGKNDSVFSAFRPTEKIFQMHGDTFDIPKTAEHLAWSDACQAQAFRYGDKIYGMQFHLEVDEKMVERWLKNNANKDFLADVDAARVPEDTKIYIHRSLELSNQTFGRFLDLFGFQAPELVGSGHGKSEKG